MEGTEAAPAAPPAFGDVPADPNREAKNYLCRFWTSEIKQHGRLSGNQLKIVAQYTRSGKFHFEILNEAFQVKQLDITGTYVMEVVAGQPPHLKVRTTVEDWEPKKKCSRDACQAVPKPDMGSGDTFEIVDQDTMEDDNGGVWHAEK